MAAYLALANDRMADYSSAICSWHNGREIIRDTFARFALPIVWDYAEVNPLSDTSGNFLGALEWVSRFTGHALESAQSASATRVQGESAARAAGRYDAIITDPPYYDAIPYSDCMDFFHVWLRRTTHGFSHEINNAFQNPLGPKWNHDIGDGELIDDASRFDGDKALSKQNYEDGMYRAFQACHNALQPNGRLVVVFANKQPDAWETLVAALIRAGLVVDGSWPIQTEMGNRNRAIGSAALASSVWLVCRKRRPGRPGRDNAVLGEMRENITQKLRDFWDAGIRGPDFVWAATGPALEAFSKHPVVKKADGPDDDAPADDEEDDTGEGGSGAKVKLKSWHRRRGRSLGLEAPGGRPAPLIDQVHKLMHLWRAGDQVRVNDYLESRNLQRNALFHQLLQALIELAIAGSEERAVLEALSNHAAAHVTVRSPRYRQPRLGETP